MKIFIISLFIFAAAVAINGNQNNKNKNIFSNIAVGQKVSLKDNGNSYTIIVSSVAVGYTITEIDENYIILKDLSDVVEIRIPLHSIKSIAIQKLP